MSLKSYTVKLKITGYAELDVDAKDDDEAIEVAKSNCTIDDVVDWEPTHRDGEHDVTCLDECDDEEEEETDEE